MKAEINLKLLATGKKYFIWRHKSGFCAAAGYIFYRLCELSHAFVCGYEDIFWFDQFQYNDVIMSAMASQITSLTIVYSTVYSGPDQRNIKALRHWPLCREFTADKLIPRTNGQ